MSKNIKCTLLAVVMFCASLIALPQKITAETLGTASNVANPSIAGSTVETTAGETVDVAIDISNNPGITALVLDVTYNNEAMTLTGVKDGGLLPGTSLIASPTLSVNPYRLLWNIGTQDVTANGSLVTLTFKVNENVKEGTYKIGISYKEEDIYNTALENVIFQIADASVVVKDTSAGTSSETPTSTPSPSTSVEPSKISKPSPSVTPSETPEPSPSITPSETPKPSSSAEPSKTLVPSASITPLPEPLQSPTPSLQPSPSLKPPVMVLKGDVDQNGKVELADAQLTLKAALKIISLDEKQIKAADVDGKAGVALSDAQLILKAALKIIEL